MNESKHTPGEIAIEYNYDSGLITSITQGDKAVNEPKHTPTPWAVRARWIDEDEDYKAYEIVRLNSDETIADCGFTEPADNGANAAHIVRCVNAFPVMLEALKAIVESNWSEYEPWLKSKKTAEAAIQTAEKEIQV